VFLLWRQRRRHNHTRMSNSAQGNHPYFPEAMSHPHGDRYLESGYGSEKGSSEIPESEYSGSTSRHNTILASGLPVHPAYIPTIKSRSSLREEAAAQAEKPEIHEAKPASGSKSSRSLQEKPSTSSLPLRDFQYSPMPIRSRSVAVPAATPRAKSTPRGGPRTPQRTLSTHRRVPSTSSSRRQPRTPRPESHARLASKSDDPPLTGDILIVPELPSRSLQATPEPDSYQLPFRLVANASPAPSTDSREGQRGRRNRPRQLTLNRKQASLIKIGSKLPVIDPSPRT
jgi:hypothetical protein